MRRLIVLLAVLLTGAVASSASAGPTKGDPRVCSFNVPAQCAHDSAITTLRIYMAAKTGHPWNGHGDIQWTAAVTCTRSGPTLFKWACSWGTGSASVSFRALSSGWRRVVTVTS